MVTTIAGDGNPGYSGEGGPALSAQIYQPRGVAIDTAGNLYIADTENDAIRRLQPAVGNLSIGATSSAASNLTGPIAPGEIIVLYGSGIGPDQLVVAGPGSDGFYGPQLAETSVTVNGIPAPVLYTWTSQVSAVVPYALEGNTAQIVITYKGQRTAPVTVPISGVAPGIFTANSSGTGQAAALNQDSTPNSPDRPETAGNVIVLFATGEGLTTPAGIDGKPSEAPFPKPLQPVTLTIGGRTAEIQYIGGAPGLIAGLLQINAVIPVGVQTGNAVPVMVRIGNVFSQSGVTIAVR